MRRALIATVGMALAVGLLTTSFAGAMTAGPSLTLHKTEYGKVLFDGKNRALYLFGRDKGRASTCYGSCAKLWPPYIVKSKPRAASGVRPSSNVSIALDTAR